MVKPVPDGKTTPTSAMPKNRKVVTLPATGAKPRPVVLDPAKLKRPPRPDEELLSDKEPPSVSAGPVDRVIELAFNPSRDKIREVTIIDRLQGRLFPILDTMNTLYRSCIEIATYRQSKQLYARLFHLESPEQLDIMDELIHRIAQWQKSIAGRNLDKATDIALAEMETKAGEEEVPGGAEKWTD